MNEISELDRLLLDLFTTALEGGINYWASVNEYHWRLDCEMADGDLDSVSDFRGFYAKVLDMEDGDALLLVNRSVMAKGYEMATTSHRGEISWSADEPPVVVTAESRDDWDFDAGDADCILQLGVFGEVVYG